MTVTITPLNDSLGAEVSGVDLAGGIDADTFALIRQASLDHLVLVFHDQDIPPSAQVAFTERFGPVEPHPLKSRAGHPDYDGLLVLENAPERRGARNDFWHSDITCAARPPSLSVLHALTVPEGKGDTMFCNMYRAWDGLPDDLKSRLDGQTAEHSGEAIRSRNNAAATDGNQDIDVPPPEVHPVARRHPETGRLALFTNRFFTTKFSGMTEEESATLLEDLEKRATVPENVYRHQWRSGDVLIWDNRCTMHYAVYDYDENEPRRLHRTTAAGDRPVA